MHVCACVREMAYKSSSIHARTGHIYTNIHTHAHTHAYTHTHVHTHARTHTARARTHTRTHTYVCMYTLCVHARVFLCAYVLETAYESSSIHARTGQRRHDVAADVQLGQDQQLLRMAGEAACVWARVRACVHIACVPTSARHASIR